MNETSEKLDRLVPGAFVGDAHAFLMAVYKDPENLLGVRIDAAKAAIAFEKPRLSSVAGDLRHQLSHEDALRELDDADLLAVIRRGAAVATEAADNPDEQA